MTMTSYLRIHDPLHKVLGSGSAAVLFLESRPSWGEHIGTILLPLSPSHVLTPVFKKHRFPRFGDYTHCSITTRTIKVLIFCTALGNYSILHHDAKESPRYLGDPWFTLVRKDRRCNFRILLFLFMAVSYLMILQDEELIQAFYTAIELNSTWTQESLETLEEIYGCLGPSPLQMDGNLCGVCAEAIVKNSPADWYTVESVKT